MLRLQWPTTPSALSREHITLAIPALMSFSQTLKIWNCFTALSDHYHFSANYNKLHGLTLILLESYWTVSCISDKSLTAWTT